MYEITLKGTLTSKRAMHVPVFRRWKLVWERRELGTAVDRIDRSYPLHFLTLDAIPPSGIRIPLPSGFALNVTREGEYHVAFNVLYNGIAVPGAVKTFHLPKVEERKGLAWHTTLWKGVKLDLEGVLHFSP